MKCAREGCQKEADRINGKYCSRSCAPFGSLGGKSTQSVKDLTAISFTAERGVPSALVFGGRKLSGFDGKGSITYPRQTPKGSPITPEKEIKISVQKPQPASAAAETRREGSGQKRTFEPIRNEEKPTETRTSSTLEKFGDYGMQETGRSTALMRADESGTEIPPEGFSKPATSLEEARSRTMTLIDSSAALLLDCMRSAAKKNGSEGIRDFRDLNAICNAGKQIAQLAKVKLDAIREARKNVD